MTRDHARAELDLRHKLRSAEDELRSAEERIVEYQTAVLELWLRDQLHDPADFFDLVGRENVVDVDKRINWREAEVRLNALRIRKPHLFVVRVAGDDVAPSP